MGKYSGTWFAAKVTGAKEKIKKYLGLALLSSASVAIGLILDARNCFEEQIPTLANLMLSIVIGKTLINELLSPFVLKYVLKKAEEIKE